jgi:hypothetical protein
MVVWDPIEWASLSNIGRVSNIRVFRHEGCRDHFVAHRFLVYHAKSKAGKGVRDSDTGRVRR